MEAIMIISSIISILAMLLVYLQSATSKANSGSILGNDNVELFENAKARGSEKIILWMTTGIVVLFFILIIVSHVI